MYSEMNSKTLDQMEEIIYDKLMKEEINLEKIDFKTIPSIGNGAYATVYGVKNLALKIIDENRKNIIPKCIIKELSLLKELDNVKNIIQIKKIILNENLFGFAMQKYDETLKEKISLIGIDDIKKIMYQLLLSLHNCHSQNIIHRDLNPGNILIDNNNNIILSDFGLSHSFYSNNIHKRKDIVQTLWYRAPEIIFEREYHSEKMDIWSCGIIMIELFTKKIGFLPGLNERTQIINMISIFGMPDEDINLYQKIQKKYHLCLNNIKKNQFDLKIFSQNNGIGELANDLLKKLLEYDPKKRISAKIALDHSYFDDIRNLEDLNTKSLYDISFENDKYDNIFNINSVINNKTRKIFLCKLLDIKNNYDIVAYEEVFMALRYFDVISNYINIEKEGLNVNENMCILLMLKIFLDYELISSFCELDEKYVLKLEIEYIKILEYRLLKNTSLTILTRFENLINNEYYYNLVIYLYILANMNYSILNNSNQEIIGTILFISNKLLGFEMDEKIKKFSDNVNNMIMDNIINRHNKYVGVNKNNNIIDFCRKNIPFLYNTKITITKN